MIATKAIEEMVFTHRKDAKEKEAGKRSDGVMEYWSIGVARLTEKERFKATYLSFGLVGLIPNTPTLHFSNTPFLSARGR